MTLRSFYWFSARCFVIAIVAIFAMSIVAHIVGNPGGKNLPFVFAFPLGTLGALCAVLFIPFWIGMMWDCLVHSKLPLYSKAAWFLFIALTVYVGLLVYYFVVYEKRNARMTTKQSRA